MNLEEALADALAQVAALNARVGELLAAQARERAEAAAEAAAERAEAAAERALLQARIEELMERVAELLAKKGKKKKGGAAPKPACETSSSVDCGGDATAPDDTLPTPVSQPPADPCEAVTGSCDAPTDVAAELPPTERPEFKNRPKPPPKPEPETKGDRSPRTAKPPQVLPTVTDPPVRPDVCAHCGKSRLENKDTQRRPVIEHVKGYVRRRVVGRTRCTCVDCNRITTPPFPLVCLPRTHFAASFVAFVLYSKIGMHLPWERVRNDLARQGYVIASSTLNSVAQRSLEALAIIAKVLWRELLAGQYMHSDATGLDVVHPGRDHVHHGQMFVFGWGKLVVFRYQPDKEGTTFKRMVAKFQGKLILDASSTHNEALELEGVFWSGCNAHGLRKFRDAVPADPVLAAEGERWVAAMFDADREGREKHGLVGDALLTWRKEKVAPIAAEFKKWIAAVHPVTGPKTPLREATTYYHDYWRALTRFLHDPNLPMDNNFAERNLRAEAVGRSNWVYAGSPQAAENLAVGYTLVQTAKAEGVDILAYLSWALERAYRCGDDLDLAARLTPAAYKEAQKSRDR